MERYHDFQIKDHYFWTGETPEYTTREERPAAKPAPQPKAPPVRAESDIVISARIGRSIQPDSDYARAGLSGLALSQRFTLPTSSVLPVR